MGATARQFRLVSSWAIDASLHALLDVVRDPLSMAAWWSAVFLRVELLEPGGPDFAGLSVRLHGKGFLPHTFKSASGIWCQACVIAFSGFRSGVRVPAAEK